MLVVGEDVGGVGMDKGRHGKVAAAAVGVWRFMGRCCGWCGGG